MSPEAETEELEQQETAEQPAQEDVSDLFDSAEPPQAADSESAAESAAGEQAEQGEEEDPWAEALAEQLAEESAGKEEEGSAQGENYSPAPLDRLEDETERRGDGQDVDLDLILDIPVTIAMEIGRTKINIRNLLQLNQGSVVELDRLAGEPLDVRVNGTLIAHGEVVVVNEKFGIRLTDVVSAQELLKNLKK